ncbi:MAG: hypothetical protein LBQ81_12840, partial [Zoogloeaceae bacterium]|nr:hypothetical protein [Zoogloeaceae bacterium]
MNAEAFNQRPDLCLDREALNAALTASGLDAQALRQSHPLLFAAAPVFVSAAEIDEMRGLITAIEAVVATPAFQVAAFAHAPEIARRDP